MLKNHIDSGNQITVRRAFDEHRERVRIRHDQRFEMTCCVDASRKTYQCTLRDISQRGIFVEINLDNEPISVGIGSTVTLLFDFTNALKSLSCYVVHVSRDGLGLRFSKDNSPQTIDVLYSHIDCTRVVHDAELSPLKIELQTAGRSWGKNTALKNISTKFESGEIVALVGPSGGGKSTLLRLIAGVLKSSSGKVLINGRNLDRMSIRELRLHRANCGIIHQQHMIVPQVTVHQNVISGMLGQWPVYKVLYSSLWPIEKQRVTTLLDKLGIADTQWKLASTLSGGQQQRVAIARAVISNPRIILADEPTASLDPTSAKEATQLIVNHAKREKALLIFCTHHLDIVKTHCDRILGLSDGQCAFDLPASKINEQSMESLYAGSRERI